MRCVRQSLYSAASENTWESTMRCWAQYLLWAVIAILGSGSLLSACGQQGNLYLPDPAEQSDEKKKK